MNNYKAVWERLTLYSPPRPLFLPFNFLERSTVARTLTPLLSQVRAGTLLDLGVQTAGQKGAFLAEAGWEERGQPRGQGQIYL